LDGQPGLLQSRLHQLLLFEASQDDDLHLGTLLVNRAGGGSAVHLGHHQVHQDDIRSRLLTDLKCFLSIARFANQLKARSDPKDGCQPPPDHAVVVHDHDSDRIIVPVHRETLLPKQRLASGCIGMFLHISGPA
jgi:hypothetical protein